MSQTLLIALTVSVPLAGLAWLAALAVEATGAGLALRLRAWMAAFLTPLAVVPMMLLIHLAGVQSPLAWTPNAPAAAPSQASTVSEATAAPSQTMVEAPSPTVRISPTPILLALLAAGAALRITGLIVSLRRVSGLAAGSRPLDPPLADRLGRRVRQADTDAPVLAGLVKPVILLPRALLNHLTVDQAALVCAHERAHLAAGDHLSHVLEEVLTRLFWFNPLLFAVRERLAATREEACDARALATCDEAERRVYAQTLITALKLAGEGHPVAAFTGFRRKGAHRRLGAVLKPAGKGSPAAWIAAALAGLGLSGALGGISLALAAEPVAPPAPVTPQAAPAPPVPPVATTPSASPAGQPVPVRPRRHTVVTIQESGEADARDSAGNEPAPKTRSWVFDDSAFAGFADLDPARMPGLTPEERDRIAKQLENARALAAQARAAGQATAAESRKRAEDGRRMAEEGRKIAEEARNRVQEQMNRAHDRDGQSLWTWRTPGAPDADGKVLMRCSVQADGSPSDCQKVTNRVMIMPLPPKPPAPPAAPPPPPPPFKS